VTKVDANSSQEPKKRQKHGGRAAGTPNKATKEFRDTVTKLLPFAANGALAGVTSLAAGVAALMAGFAGPKVWYDPWDISTLQQDAAGTTPVNAAGDRAPVAFTSPCPPPDDLAEPALQKELEVWAALWIGAYGCEKSKPKRTRLIDSWPR